MPRHSDPAKIVLAKTDGVARRLCAMFQRDAERADQVRAVWPELVAVLEELRAVSALPDGPSL
jgi:hypothetical protein